MMMRLNLTLHVACLQRLNAALAITLCRTYAQRVPNPPPALAAGEEMFTEQGMLPACYVEGLQTCTWPGRAQVMSLLCHCCIFTVPLMHHYQIKVSLLTGTHLSDDPVAYHRTIVLLLSCCYYRIALSCCHYHFATVVLLLPRCYFHVATIVLLLSCCYCRVATIVLLLSCCYYRVATTVLLLSCCYYRVATIVLLLSCCYYRVVTAVLLLSCCYYRVAAAV
jgi:hypothetical protein